MRMAADILKSRNFECQSNITKSRDENRNNDISQKNIDINNILEDSRN